MLDLKHNPFFVLGVTPQSTQGEIVEACEDAIEENPEWEHEYRSKQDELLIPKKRLSAELTFLWGVPVEDWDQLLSSSAVEMLYGANHAARINVAAHLCSTFHELSDEHIQIALSALIESRDAINDVYLEIQNSRKVSGMPKPQQSHFNEAVESLSSEHRKAAMRGIEYANHGGFIMQQVVEQWRYDQSSSGRFVIELSREYDRWTISILRPIEQRLEKIIKILGDGKERPKLLDEIDSLLSRWDEFSQPMQLINEAKGLDDPRSREICDKLRALAISLNNTHDQPSSALRISQALLKTFVELPGQTGQIASDVHTLKKMSKQKDVISTFMSVTNLIRSRYEAFAAEISQVQQGHQGATPILTKFKNATKSVLQTHSDSEEIWMCLHVITYEMMKSGYYQSAQWLMSLYVQYAEYYGAPKDIKERTIMLDNQMSQSRASSQHSDDDGFGKAILWIFAAVVVIAIIFS